MVRLIISALVALSGLAGCTEVIVGDAVFFCAPAAPCGAGQTCRSCPVRTVHTPRSVCVPEGGDLIARCGGDAPDVTSPDVMQPDAARDTTPDTTTDTRTDVPIDVPTDTPTDAGGGPPPTPTIRASRTSGAAPLFVRFSVDALDGDLTYLWRFGDPGGTWARDGAPRGTELGPVAAHLFASAGSYAVTLTVRAANGQEASDTLNVSVSGGGLFGSTVCFANSFGGDSCPNGGVVLQGLFFDVLMQQVPIGTRRILLRRGDTFDAFTTATLGSGPGLIGAYGTASAAPIIRANQMDVLTVGNGDWRLVDLAFAEAGAAQTALRATAQVTLVRVSATGAGALLESTAAAGLVDVMSAGSVSVAGGALLGSDVAGRLELAGGPFVVAHSSVADGVRAASGACAGVGSVIDSDLRRADGAAITGFGCPAHWSVARNRVEATDGVRLIGAGRAAVHTNVILMPAGDVSGVLVGGLGSRVDQNTCYQPDAGGTCVRIAADAQDAAVINQLMVAPAGATLLSDQGARTLTCDGCNVQLVPTLNLFVSASPDAVGDFALAPGSAALDRGEDLPRRRFDLGRNCRPANGRWDVGAWERGATACP